MTTSARVLCQTRTIDVDEEGKGVDSLFPKKESVIIIRLVTWGTHMPYVRVEITDGATVDQKKALYAGITDLLVKVLNKKPEYTFIVIDEVDGDNWGHKGTSVAEIRKAEAAASTLNEVNRMATTKTIAAKAPAKKSTAKKAAKKAPAKKAAKKAAKK
jgi:4-oxalocrotonate tautomerase